MSLCLNCNSACHGVTRNKFSSEDGIANFLQRAGRLGYLLARTMSQATTPSSPGQCIVEVEPSFATAPNKGCILSSRAHLLLDDFGRTANQDVLVTRLSRGRQLYAESSASSASASSA
eukprot:354248-Chlamydomonas_euryale.AAC.5